MAVRQLRKILRRPMYVVYLFVQPVIFVLLFRYVFGGAINTGGVSYVNYLMPGIIVMTAMFGALTTGLGLTEDLKSWCRRSPPSLPISRSAVLIGRTAADLATNTVTLVAMLLIGFAVGFRPSQSVDEVALAIVLVLAFAYVFSWISAYIGLTLRDPETVQSIGLLWVIPLVFASSAFVPTSSMPTVLRAIADVNPVSLTVNGARALMIGHGHAAGAHARSARMAGRSAARVRAAVGASVAKRVNLELAARARSPQTRGEPCAGAQERDEQRLTELLDRDAADVGERHRSWTAARPDALAISSCSAPGRWPSPLGASCQIHHWYVSSCG